MHETTESSLKLKLMPEPRNNGRAEELRDLLERVRRLCEESGEGFSNLRTRIGELEERLAEGRFHLAVLGQFKRGKSTLLNALLGEPLLPMGVVPLTSIPTFLRAGKARGVRIVFLDGRQINHSDLTLEQASEVLARHVTEKENPRNQVGVESVEVEHPCALLTDGVVLIDTPGIGSTLRHNTDATLHFLSQCDAALFVVSADPPITEVEKDFLKAVQGKVAKLCFVMNKIDYLSQTDLAEAVNFFEDVLKELAIRNPGPIFNVSAKRGMEARVEENLLRWHESGVEELQNYLLDFLSREKSRTLQMALARKAGEIVADAALNVALQKRSLQLSRQELDSRLKAFDVKVQEIEQERIRVGDLLAGDRKRTVQLLEERAETLRLDARRHLRQTVSEALRGELAAAAMEQRGRDRLAAEIPVYFAQKLVLSFDEMNQALHGVLAPYHERLDALVGALRATAAELFEIPYHPSESNGRLQEVYRPYWVTQKWNTLISPVPEGFLDRFLPAELRKRRLENRLAEDMETLVIHNVENLRWATLRNVDDAFRRFSSALETRLNEAAENTREAIRAAGLRRKHDEETAAPEILSLEQKGRELADLGNSLSQYAESL